MFVRIDIWSWPQVSVKVAACPVNGLGPLIPVVNYLELDEMVMSYLLRHQ